MSNNRGGFSVPPPGRGGSTRAHVPYPYERIPNPPAMTGMYNPIRTTFNPNNHASQPVNTDAANTTQSGSGVVRHHGNRSQNSQARGGGSRGNYNNHYRQSDANHNTRHSSLRPDSANFVPAAENISPKTSSVPHISYNMLSRLLNDEPDKILGTMLGSGFQLSQYLNDKRMESRTDWVPTMTSLLEKILDCKGSRERIVIILEQLPGTVYLEGVYNAVRKPDAVTDQLRFPFIKSFLKICNVFLSMIPHSADDFTKIFERIELLFTKIQTKSSESEETKLLLDEVLERVNEIERRNQKQQKTLNPKNDTSNAAVTTTTANNNTQRDSEPPPDDYRLLPIVPDVTEILSDRQTYLRANIIDGTYNNPRHYLDIHFRLLREDFVGPLRDGIQQYLSGSPGKNFDVRIYENVRSLGPRLSPVNGLVYDLFLDPKTASKLSWVNSRRLMFGNLLVLTFDRFQSCIFVTVEDRSRIEKDLVISVKTLDKVNNNEQTPIDLDQIDFSYSLTMIETMTYFEAYRPVLNALQLIDPDQTFPLAQFLLQASSAMISPDYVTPASVYDFTPLLVEPNSEVKTRLIVQEAEPVRRGRGAGFVQPVVTKEFRINYIQSNQVARKYRSVKLLNKDEWPTSDELHLNPKQREALVLALTNKVALIQGPPGTGKTFLGVRITEMLLHNRSVWCPSLEQSTPILMICQTNHALDQFLELIIKRLNITEGVIRVGNRCQNPAIKPFSLLQARRLVRDARSIPKHVYYQKHVILDRKKEAEETLKVYEYKFGLSRSYIMPLSTFLECYLINDRHVHSLLAPYNYQVVDTALSDWLGLGHEFEQISEDLIDLVDIENNMSNMEIKDDDDDKTEIDTPKKQEENGDTEEKPQQSDADQQPDQEEQNDGKEEENEEDEEEQRRRDELDMDEEHFIPSIVNKPQTTQSNPINEQRTANREDDDDGEGEWQVVNKKPYDRRRLIKLILQYPTTLNDETVQLINLDLWQLPNNERQNLYRYWLLKYQQYLIHAAREARQHYNQAAAALAEYHQEEDYHILKDAVIVAMTTTCAAKYHTVLEKLESKIVIVEEAAAIFEAHIITALSTKCEHLILIGDHVQLRPNPSVHRLAIKYRLDVSLFERFVRNNFPNVRLNIQHRMRPEIARLMKHFYDDLEDHDSVKTNRPSICGIESNVYFINHTNIETAVPDGSSKRNEHEAKYIIALTQYLIKQGYRPEQITVLVMYLGQRQYIAKQTKQIKMLQGVRIMVTDNYQGEENDIIILSLIRSNAEKQIGFLRTHNRICVALSRARCGLFVMGNMTMLADAEEMWKKIAKSLIETNEIGNSLCLSCRQHSKEKFLADKPESFAKRPEGGCNKPCDARLKCGHQCELMCHNYDFEHQEIVCHKKCRAPFSCGHLCTKRCHASNPNQHDPCRVLVEKTVVGCGHKINFQCARTPTVNDCTQPILKRLPCDHAVNVPCSIASSPSALKRFSCPEPCNTLLACKHRCVGTCGSCRTGQLHEPCREKCERSLICSHVCKAPCAHNCPPCQRSCQTRCTHSHCKAACGQLCTPCKEPCDYKCKHLQCTRLCFEPCNRGPCNEPCEKKLKCGHDCIGICGELCPSQCRICNKHIVQNILFGSEDEPDARFVLLPDCEHIIEVTALDRIVQESLNRPDESTAIRFPECPQCKQPIRRCRRYMPIINQMNNLIAQVKKKILGNHSEQDINKQRKRLVEEWEKAQTDLKRVHHEQVANMFAPLFIKESFLTNGIITLLTNVLAFLRSIDKLLVNGSEKLQPNIFEDLVSAPLYHIVRYLSKYCQSRNFAEQQLIDIQAELRRIDRLIYIEALVFSLKAQRTARHLKADEEESIVTMQYLVNKTGPFTEQDQVKFDGLIKKIEHLSTLPGLGITEKERIGIVSALNMQKGHWYVCPKGHPYLITECGGATQVSKCPECGEKIGGENHLLLPTNRHFGLMDDSQNAAWSNEANLNINPADL